MTVRPRGPHRLDDPPRRRVHAVGILTGRRLVEDERSPGSMASTPASVTSFRTRPIEVVRVGGAVVGEPGIARAAGDERVDVGRRARAVARPERHLALDGPFEQLIVRVLEGEPDGPRAGRRGSPSIGRPSSRTRPALGRNSPMSA